MLVLLLDIYTFSFIRIHSTHGINGQQKQQHGKKSKPFISLSISILKKKTNSFKSVDALCQRYNRRMCVYFSDTHIHHWIAFVSTYIARNWLGSSIFFYFFQSKFKFTDISHIGLMCSNSYNFSCGEDERKKLPTQHSATSNRCHYDVRILIITIKENAFFSSQFFEKFHLIPCDNKFHYAA